MAAGHSVEPDRWQAEADRLLGGMAGRFARVETRRRARGFLLGLLADLPRKNCWTIAEHAGDPDPHGMQHLLARASWDTDGVRDDLRDYVTGHLGDTDAVLVVDETGDEKKGVYTVGVQRQYTGTAGRIENAQVAVYLTYAGERGHAMIDRELYLPKSWTSDDARCAAAGVPADIEFATKPALATGMLVRALNAGVPARGVAGDEVYGADPGLRAALELRRIGYVLAIGASGGSRPRPGCYAPTRSPPVCPAGPGSDSPQAREPRDSATTTGPWSLTPTPPAGPTRPTRPIPSAGGCWCAATVTPVSWRSTAATPLSRCRCGNWSASPAGAGRWRNRSRPARAWPGLMSIRSGAGPPGGAGPCSR